MSATSVRWAALGVFFLLGIPGMIVSSINDNNGAAVTFGLVAAAAALVLIAVTAATTGRIAPEVGSRTALRADPAGGPGASAEVGSDLEARIQTLIDGGADEAEVRALVGEAVKYGRFLSRR